MKTKQIEVVNKGKCKFHGEDAICSHCFETQPVTFGEIIEKVDSLLKWKEEMENQLKVLDKFASISIKANNERIGFLEHNVKLLESKLEAHKKNHCQNMVD